MMNSEKGFFDWKFSPVEVLGFGFSIACVAVSISLWAVFTFQSKEDAKDVKAELESKIIGVHTEVQELKQNVNTVREGVAEIGKDVSYIRGRLEPKSGK